jgi:hypothetical protein
MKYFETLPKIVQTINGQSNIYTNLLARASMLPKIMTDPSNYYQYDIQEGDTPEIIADKYYGDSYRYWIVLFSNQLLDPQWDWPMSTTLFEHYMKNKYSNINPHNVMHHYEKTITQYSPSLQTTFSDTIILDQSSYDDTVERTYSAQTPSGVISITIDKMAVTLYDYEYNLNESKRTISLLNKMYVDSVEKELKTLMSS